MNLLGGGAGGEAHSAGSYLWVQPPVRGRSAGTCTGTNRRVGQTKHVTFGHAIDGAQGVLLLERIVFSGQATRGGGVGGSRLTLSMEGRRGGLTCRTRAGLRIELACTRRHNEKRNYTDNTMVVYIIPMCCEGLVRGYHAGSVLFSDAPLQNQSVRYVASVNHPSFSLTTIKRSDARSFVS